MPVGACLFAPGIGCRTPTLIASSRTVNESDQRLQDGRPALRRVSLQSSVLELAALSLTDPFDDLADSVDDHSRGIYHHQVPAAGLRDMVSTQGGGQEVLGGQPFCEGQELGIAASTRLVGGPGSSGVRSMMPLAGCNSLFVKPSQPRRPPRLTSCWMGLSRQRPSWEGGPEV